MNGAVNKTEGKGMTEYWLDYAMNCNALKERPSAREKWKSCRSELSCVSDRRTGGQTDRWTDGEQR